MKTSAVLVALTFVLALPHSLPAQVLSAHQVVDFSAGLVECRSNPADPYRPIEDAEILLGGTEIRIHPRGWLKLRHERGELHLIDNPALPKDAPEFVVPPSADAIAAAREKSIFGTRPAGKHRGGARLYAPANGARLSFATPIVFRWVPVARPAEIMLSVWSEDRRQIWGRTIAANAGELVVDDLLAQLGQSGAPGRLYFVCSAPGVAPDPADINECTVLTAEQERELARELAQCGAANSPWYHLLRAAAWTRFGVEHEAFAEFERALADEIHHRNRDLLLAGIRSAEIVGQPERIKQWRSAIDAAAK